MTSREAFEAWFKPTFTMTAHGANPETAMLSRLFTWHGRAGKPPYIHACDVAAEIVLRELDDNGQVRHQ